MGAFESFDPALQIDPDFVEDYFNAALALHHLGQQEEATQRFRLAGELNPRNTAIVPFALFRNHSGLSSALEPHLDGCYR